MRRIIIIFLSFLLPLPSFEAFAGGTYEVKNYGILPNGDPIASKLEHLTRKVSSEGGGIILFEAGEYNFDAALTDSGTPIGGVRMYANVYYQGVEGTVLKANLTGKGFHSLFATVDNTVRNVVFDNLTFDTYVGTNNRDVNDFRLAIALHWCKDITIRNCRFIHDIGTIDTRYSHKQEDKDNGEYRVDGLIVEDCVFKGKLLNENGYRDITVFGVCAQNVLIRNNVFSVEGKIKRQQNKYYPNCCIELQGRDMWVYGNTFKDYTNAIDFTATDKYQGKRHINIYNNTILCYRGIALWCNEGQAATGFRIYNNYFRLACDNENKRVTSVKGCVVLATHPTDSYNGRFEDIYINGNTFDYSYEKSFYMNKAINRWNSIPQHKTDFKNGISFEEYYSAVALGGSSLVRDNIVVSNNKFLDCCFPCVYIGGKSVSTQHVITFNTYENCSNDGRFPIVSVVNQCKDLLIWKNTIKDTRARKKGGAGLFFCAKWSGLNTVGYVPGDQLQFDNLIISNNHHEEDNNSNKNERYISDFSKLDPERGNVYDNVLEQ